MKRWIKGMRDSFFDSLYNLAKKDKDIILITSDTGAICLDKFKKNLKGRYINIGIAEQNMVSVAAGMAMSGKKVYIYAIVPFATMRCYEQIRIDLCCMNLPVTVIGIGAGFDYSTLGPTHHGTEDIALMRVLPGMAIYSPSDTTMTDCIAGFSYKEKGPKYIRLDRTGRPLIYKNKRDIDISRGFSLLKEGKDLYIIATGRMVYNALKISEKLSAHSIRAGVIDLFRIKPFNTQGIWPIINKAGYLMTLEEHFVTGGIGSIVSEILATKKNAPAFRPFGIPDNFCREYGTREYLHSLNKIDTDSIAGSVKRWIAR